METAVVGLLSAVLARHMWRVSRRHDPTEASVALPFGQRCTSADYAATCTPIAGTRSASVPVARVGEGTSPHAPELECAVGAQLSPTLLVLILGSAKTRCQSNDVSSAHAAGRVHRTVIRRTWLRQARSVAAAC